MADKKEENGSKPIVKVQLKDGKFVVEAAGSDADKLLAAIESALKPLRGLIAQ